MYSVGLDFSLTDSGIVIIQDGKVVLSEDVKSSSEGKNMIERINRISDIYDRVHTHVNLPLMNKKDNIFNPVKRNSYNKFGRTDVNLTESDKVLDDLLDIFNSAPIEAL